MQAGKGVTAKLHVLLSLSRMAQTVLFTYVLVETVESTSKYTPSAGVMSRAGNFTNTTNILVYF